MVLHALIAALMSAVWLQRWVIFPNYAFDIAEYGPMVNERDRPATEEIEVTDEMAQAGAHTLTGGL